MCSSPKLIGSVYAWPSVEGCKDLSASATASVCTTIMRCILGTDMKHHARLLADLAVVCTVDAFASVADGRQLLLAMSSHGTDLAQPRDVALKWVDHMCEEFADHARKSAGRSCRSTWFNLEKEVIRCRLQMNFLDCRSGRTSRASCPGRVCGSRRADPMMMAKIMLGLARG